MEINTLRLREKAAKLFFIVLVVIIGIDTLPLGISAESGPFSFIYKLKSAIRPALRPIGLWQSEWRLFAPDPVICNCWWTIEVRGKLSAELQSELQRSGQPLLVGESSTLTWNSPFWGEIRPAEKFFNRRRIAYSRRLGEFPIAVIEDFADDWVRERFGDRLHPLGNVPLENGTLENGSSNANVDPQTCMLELSVFRNELQLAMPDDGTLPSREDIIWLSVTKNYLERRYGE